MWDSVGEQDRKALQELRGSGLVDANESDTAGPGQMMSVWLTAKGGDALLVPAPESSCGDPR